MSEVKELEPGVQIEQRGYDCTVFYYPEGNRDADLARNDFTIGDVDELFVIPGFTKLNCGLDHIGNMTYALIPTAYVTEVDIDPHYEYVEKQSNDSDHIPY